MRNSCIECVIKHITQAHILMHEAKHEYPLHGDLAMGHLAQAEVEVEQKSRAMAMRLREIRLGIQDEDVDFDVIELLGELHDLRARLEVEANTKQDDDTFISGYASMNGDG